LFEGATIQDLAKALLRRPTEISWSPVTAIHPDGSKRPFFFLHGDFTGGGFYCLNLARALGPEQPFYALHPHGLDGRPVPASIEGMAADHLATVRALQPQGPYLLGGHCNGGLIAFEMARRLLAAGERVDLLALLDAATGNTWFGAGIIRGLVNVLGAIGGLTPRQRLETFGRLRRRMLWLRQRCGSNHDTRVAVLRRHARGNRVALADLSRRLENEAEAPDASPAMASSPRPRTESLLEMYRQTVDGYIPRWYAGRITLFRSGDGSRWRADLGWRAVAREVEIRVIPGDHLTSVTRHVRVIGEYLNEYLQQVRSP
jgi:thioesterase domain-containing protein